MKWNNNGIQYKRGCYECLIARYDESSVWFTPRAQQTQQSQKSNFKRLGELLEASKCEVMPMYDDNDEWTQNSIVVFDFHYSGECKFYSLLEDGRMIPMDVKAV